jgi:hypothetical protein
MDWHKATLVFLSAAICAILCASCATAPPPPQPPPEPQALLMPPGQPPPPDEWNIFPDPTTGRVDVYHKGDYVGAVTGNEPPSEDPPMPHPLSKSE